MTELASAEINLGDEIRKTKKVALPEAAPPTTTAELEVVYDAATLVRGAKVWFGATRPRVASLLKHSRIQEATRAQVSELLKGK